MIGQSTAEGRHGFLNLAMHTVVDGVLILSLSYLVLMMKVQKNQYKLI